VDGLNPARVKSVLDVAIARFNKFQSLNDEIAKAKASLAERKVIERAKGILMREKKMGEDAAYQTPAPRRHGAEQAHSPTWPNPGGGRTPAQVKFRGQAIGTGLVPPMRHMLRVRSAYAAFRVAVDAVSSPEKVNPIRAIG